MEKYKITIPILLIGFNRPSIIKQNLENLSQFSINKMYVAVDGPRKHVQGEDQKVNQVIDLVKQVDFCDEVEYRINEINKGCEITVSSAISWVLEKEEYLIVLEDDIIAHESFFRFMDEMLNRYKNDDRIAMVSGCNYTPMSFPDNADYCFCQSGHISGWGTWKRVWKDNILFDEIDSKHLSSSFLITHSANKEIAKSRRILYAEMKSKGKGNNTWDYMFSYFRVTRGLLSIVPKSHLTSNIGLYGLHGNGEGKGLNMIIDDDFVVKVHPESVFWFKDYDVYHYKNWSKPSGSRIKITVINLLKKVHIYSTLKKIQKTI